MNEAERAALLNVARAAAWLPRQGGSAREDINAVIVNLTAYRQLLAALNALPAATQAEIGFPK